MNRWFVISLGILILGYTGCTRMTSEMTQADAKMINTNGDAIGSATLREMGAGIQLHLSVHDLEPGLHALHIHQGTECIPPDFTSAEGHFNPEGKAHGFDATGGPHAGDLRNLEVGSDGTVEVDRTLSGLTLGTGEMSIMGKTIMIHQGPDDYVSQPSGDAGARIACGVIQPAMGPDTSG